MKSRKEMKTIELEFKTLTQLATWIRDGETKKELLQDNTLYIYYNPNKKVFITEETEFETKNKKEVKNE